MTYVQPIYLAGFFTCTISIHQEGATLYKANISNADEYEDTLSAHGDTYQNCLTEVKQMLLKRAYILIDNIKELE